MRDAAARRRLLDDCADFPGFLGTDRRVKYRHGICADDEAGVIARGRSVDTIRAVTERHRAQGPPLGSLHIARRQIKRARIDIRRDDRRAFPAVPQAGTSVGRNALRLQRVARLAVVFIDEAFVAGCRGFHELRCRIDGDDGCPACPISKGHVHITARVIDRKVRCSRAGVGQQQTWRQMEQVAELLGAGRCLSPVDFVAIAPADEVDRCPGRLASRWSGSGKRIDTGEYRIAFEAIAAVANQHHALSIRQLDDRDVRATRLIPRMKHALHRQPDGWRTRCGCERVRARFEDGSRVGGRGGLVSKRQTQQCKRDTSQVYHWNS